MTLVTVGELADAMTGERPPVLLDVRWRLGGPPGREDYLTGHIPGAVYVDLDTELSGTGQLTEGRHPLPSPAELEASMQRWGVDDGDGIVVYDGEGGLAAARAWWLLRWAGVTEVRLLDGALPAWVASGGRLDAGEVAPRPGTAQVRPDSLPTLDADQAGDWPRRGVLLDARAAERYRGETEPVDPKAGHIPGALSAPTTDTLAPDGRFRSPAELARHFADVGVDGDRPVAVYCGSGVTAAHEIAALAVAGIDATLYPGSWSQWSNLDLPVETGPPQA